MSDLFDLSSIKTRYENNLKQALTRVKEELDKKEEISSTGDWVTNVNIGGLQSGTDTSNMSAMEILKAITKKYTNPTCNVSFSETNATVENGTTINLEIEINGFVEGDGELSLVDIYQDDTLIETYSISSLTDVFNVTINNISSDTTFTIKLIDNNGVITEKTKTYKFVNPTYVGVVANDSITEEGIANNCTKLIREKGTYSQSFTTDDEAIVFASVWELSDIINQNNYSVLSAFTKQNITINNVDLICYSLSNTTLDNFNYKFIY